MSLVRNCTQARRVAGRMATAGLLAMGLSVGVDAQDPAGGAESAEGVVSALEAVDASTAAPGQSDDEEMLFADGPREPGVLSAEGTLIGSGAKKFEARAEGDAVAALVASVTAGANAPDSGGEGGLEEVEETGIEESRGSAPSLLERFGGFLGLGGD